MTCGATEAMIAAMIGCLDPGQEVVVFEPFYENYGADAIIAGRQPAVRHAPRTGLDVSTRPNWQRRSQARPALS